MRSKKNATYVKEFCYNKNEKMKFKLQKKLEIIIIIQENLEELLIAFAI